MFNGSLAGTRYSPLDAIDAGNVGTLRQAFVCDMGSEPTGFQCTPVVADGRPRWSHRHDGRITPAPAVLGLPNRGVAVADGKVYRVFYNGHVIALDARTGGVAWDVAVGQPDAHEYMNMAPVVSRGTLLVATAGGDVGAVGRVVALDASTGRQKWSWRVVPAEGDGPAADTWPAGIHRAGGGIYSSLAVDEATGTVYAPTGNPAPDFVRDVRRGDNRYTCCVVMLDAATGRYKGHRQFVKNDYHDWNISASPVLVTSRSGREMVVAAGKQGLVYGMTRDLKTVHFERPVSEQFNVDAPLTREGTRFAPGTAGGVNFYGPTYSPRTNLIYVGSSDRPTTLKITDENPKLERGKPWLGSADFGTFDTTPTGRITAIDADTGALAWRVDLPKPQVGGLTPTAGGLVFAGTLDGHLLALDARTGRELHRVDLGRPIGGGVSTYELGGRQYVAVGLTSKQWEAQGGRPRVVVFALPDAAARL